METPNSPGHHNWDPYLISCLAIVCAVVLVFCYQKIIRHACCTINILTFSGDHDQRNQLLGLLQPANSPEHSLSLEFQSRGLEPTMVRSLPVSQFKKELLEETNSSCCNSECGVCLGEFEGGEWLRHLPNCSHVFHVECIDRWFQSHSTCPLCRSNVSGCCSNGSEEMVRVYSSLLETLRREDFHHERARSFQVMRAEVLQSSVLRYGAAAGSNGFNHGSSI